MGFFQNLKPRIWLSVPKYLILLEIIILLCIILSINRKGGNFSYFEKIMLIYSVLHTLIVDCSKKGIRNFKAFYEVTTRPLFWYYMGVKEI